MYFRSEDRSATKPSRNRCIWRSLRKGFGFFASRLVLVVLTTVARQDAEQNFSLLVGFLQHSHTFLGTAVHFAMCDFRLCVVVSV
jgi:hypothetical protein